MKYLARKVFFPHPHITLLAGKVLDLAGDRAENAVESRRMITPENILGSFSLDVYFN